MSIKRSLSLSDGTKERVREWIISLRKAIDRQNNPKPEKTINLVSVQDLTLGQRFRRAKSQSKKGAIYLVKSVISTDKYVLVECISTKTKRNTLLQFNFNDAVVLEEKETK